MSAFFSTLSCCWFWLLLGILIGWLLNRWLYKYSHKNNPTQSIPASKTVPTSTSEPLPAKLAQVPASTVVAPTPQAIPSEVKATPKSAAKPAKPKAATSVVVIDIAAAKAAGFSLKNADDLTIIEGIGPKINELFVDSGIKTFAQLAEQTVPQMRAILDKGGARFRIANPSTWAQQAKLASTNKWSELKKLQSDLSGGVKK
jgi:predicted flap endonuclease-1-like 5' DNA nuclease